MIYPVLSLLAGFLVSCVIVTFAASMVSRYWYSISHSKKRLGCIDGLRGYLAVSVLAHHFIIWMQVDRLGGKWAEPDLAIFNEFGKGGVALFFMGTGFVFYPYILKGFRANFWPSIYISRVFRIVPLVAASVLLITLIIIIRTGNGFDSTYPLAFLRWITASGQPPLLGYVDSWMMNAGVLWSLWFEWIFYLLLFPFSAAIMDLIRGRLPSWIVPAVLILISVIIKISGIKISLFTYIPLFSIGMLAYEIQMRETIAKKLRSQIATVAAIVALAIGMIVFSNPYTYAAPLFGFFFVCVASGNNMAGFLETKGALMLGECSYGIYLLHGLLLNILFVDLKGFADLFSTDTLSVLMPVVSVATVLFSALTYVIVERPSMRLGKKISKRWFNDPVSAGQIMEKSAL